ncbi:unnamed protein product [Bursaphelenchus xylophilus]|uniref:RNA-directed DNA polymerase n=1 Tax=Bursaphelenchus xylophilus TaxID=6326 RepID=A0A7I8XDJ5_BURXY|nr:unnamed protein product [Bursaphelenchus xylophilus]CAG9113771.1 unnamed protein product [Bursaphelenchus xylophilus]
MNELKRELSASFLVYMDDIIVGSSTEADHLADIENFFKTIIRFGLKLRIEKCVWGVAEIKYLGLLISKQGSRPDPKNLEAVRKFEKPTTLSQLRSFIGCVSYFRRFIPKFAEIMAPLYELTAGGQDQVQEKWAEAQDKAFKEVVERLLKAPVLAAPRFGYPFIIETDASHIAIAAVLLQKSPEDAKIHPIVYASRKLNQHEARYSFCP